MHRYSLFVLQFVGSVFSSKVHPRLGASRSHRIAFYFVSSLTSPLTAVPLRIIMSLVASLVAFSMVLVGVVSPAAAAPQLELESDWPGSLISISNGDRYGDKTHTLVVSGVGEVYAVGDNSEGQLGIGSTGSKVVSPVAVDVSVALVGQAIVSVAGGRQLDWCMQCNT